MIYAFEGPEGSGKGTQIKLLEPLLRKKGIKVMSIIEPGGTPAGQAIRNVLLHVNDLDLLGITEAFLFSASRAQQVRTVTRPALAQGYLVLSDRSFEATKAYQGYGRGVALSVIMQLTSIAVEDTKPDLTFLLDVDPKIGLARKPSNDKNRLDKESIKFHRRVRRGYLELASADPEHWKKIDASKTIQEVHEQIVKIIFAELRIT
ncbi:dTMP kinase [candidate division WWE3 bacterium RBG_19FT_COMBO_34_6]|uniref:Thymidylate kinase n=1 Tax=candidate division WWE3 bacterium RBG_19FT_COMBO_34_6 TaxID=1802612 RepID=A0A1F4UJU9_UNCKA|nr:MAG: dTMP kinase [candidate division WWE3 bacterium RBG_19FT_COMBO_34_6]